MTTFTVTATPIIVPEPTTRIVTVRNPGTKRKTTYYAMSNTEFVLSIEESDGGGYTEPATTALVTYADFIFELQSAVSQS